MDDWAAMVVAIVMIAGITSVMRERAKYKHKERMGNTPSEVSPDVMARLHDMEERVKVLEAIVTDRNYDLKSQIDDLDRR